MSNNELFLIALLIIFSLPYLIWRIGRTDDFAPLVVVQIVGGILLGPGILGVAAPSAYASLFAPPVLSMLNGVAAWAVMLFVWSAGIEIDLGDAWRNRRETIVTASSALLVPFLFGCGAAIALIAWSGDWIGPRASPLQLVAGIGMACAVTALPILVLFLEKLGALRTAFGQRVLRYASLDDVVIWGVLALILVDMERIERQLIFVPAFLAGAVAIRWMMPKLAERDRWYAGLMWLVACGLAADWCGFHYMVGAFLSGAALDTHWFDTKARDSFRRIVLLAFMPVFFLSTGIRTSWGIGSGAVFGAALLLLVASVAGKLVGVGLAAQALKWKRHEAWLVGWLLQTKALIMIIFVNVLFDREIISGNSFTALLLMAVASTMLSIPFTRRSPILPELRKTAPQAGSDAS
ncbi:MAG: cation:proton antiporter [Sphingomonas sp.]|nr:cation:proton antiporter [Sphingomonas sp.]